MKSENVPCNQINFLQIYVLQLLAPLKIIVNNTYQN